MTSCRVGVAHWRWHADQARRDLLDPAVAPFYGCLSMALTAVSAGTMIVGRAWLAIALYALLVGPWAVTAVRTARGTVTGELVVRRPEAHITPGRIGITAIQ